MDREELGRTQEARCCAHLSLAHLRRSGLFECLPRDYRLVGSSIEHHRVVIVCRFLFCGVPTLIFQLAAIEPHATNGRLPGRPVKRQVPEAELFVNGDSCWLAGFCLPGDHSICFPDGAAFIAGSFQTFIGDFRPELLQLCGCRFVGVPFSIIRSPWHLERS